MKEDERVWKWHGGVVLHDGGGKAKVIVLSNEAARSWGGVRIVMNRGGGDNRSEWMREVRVEE